MQYIINLEPSYHMSQKYGAPDDYQKHGVLGRCLVCLPLSMALTIAVETASSHLTCFCLTVLCPPGAQELAV